MMKCIFPLVLVAYSPWCWCACCCAAVVRQHLLSPRNPLRPPPQRGHPCRQPYSLVVTALWKAIAFPRRMPMRWPPWILDFSCSLGKSIPS